MGLIIKAWRLTVEALKAAREASEMAKAVRLAKASQQAARDSRIAQKAFDAAEVAKKTTANEEGILADVRAKAAAERKSVAQNIAQAAKEKALKAALPIKNTKTAQKAAAARQAAQDAQDARARGEARRAFILKKSKLKKHDAKHPPRPTPIEPASVVSSTPADTRTPINASTKRGWAKWKEDRDEKIANKAARKQAYATVHPFQNFLKSKVLGWGSAAALVAIEVVDFSGNILSEQKKVPLGQGGDMLGVYERAALRTASDTIFVIGHAVGGLVGWAGHLPIVGPAINLVVTPAAKEGAKLAAPVIEGVKTVAKKAGDGIQHDVIDPARQRTNERAQQAIETPLITEDDDKVIAGMFNHNSSSAQPSPNPVPGTGSGRQGPAPAYVEHRANTDRGEIGPSVTKTTEQSSSKKTATPVDPEAARRAADRATFQKYLDSHKNDAPPPPSNPTPPPSADSGAIQSASYSLPATGRFAQPFAPSVVKTAVTSSIQAPSAVSQAASFVPDKGGDAYAVTAVYTGLTTPNRPNYSQLARTTVTPPTQGRVAIRPGQVVNLSGMSADYG